MKRSNSNGWLAGLAVVGAIILARPAGAGDWPMLGHDIARGGAVCGDRGPAV